MMMYLHLVGGLLLLLIAGDLLVRGAIALATRLGIPPLIIGLTIVSFGTSAPELIISLRAAFEGAAGIAIGNVVGSNITNILLVLGMPALIRMTQCTENGVRSSTVFMMTISIVFTALCWQGVLDITAGIILLSLLAFFLSWTVWTSRKQKGEPCDLMDDDMLDEAPSSLGLAVLFTVVGIIGLPIGGNFTIDGATAIARTWGVSEATIGLTVVALGTSLPELVTTLVAAIRNQGAVAIGNVVGSNIFNILAIMGLTATIIPIRVPSEVIDFDLWIMLASSALMLPVALLRMNITRMRGIAMLIAYATYIAVVFKVGELPDISLGIKF
ncbi:calcium/sodium antiporter [Cohaesibacter sp. CAU 1516]|uniref:calcium/sodium antiporter n=1 Tax=Cohaesibacter sp. CAU 1516 TaxID=2576038 RepID=UPI0010FDD857|nr:calcium/sodium antiporter [Cohaesibacter sp. CAU 1516]TLP48334.1 calcium/sodium antiporter [Cohaesibacter sp. CAU 1516]